MRLGWFACAILLAVSTIASADTPADAGTVRYACDPQSELHVWLVDATSPAPSAAEALDPAALVTYSKEDARGEVQRTGSREILRQSGPYSVKFKGGYYNANPQGELGAAEEYPLFEILLDGETIAGPFALGSLEPDNPRMSAMASCPDDWIVSPWLPLGRGGGPGRMLYLTHQTDESRAIAVPADGRPVD